MLAGFPDDLADEGPSAGPASLVGLKIARQKGWPAPSGWTAHQVRTRGRRGRGRHHRRQGRGQPATDAKEAEADAKVEEFAADPKHEHNRDDPGGDDK